MKLLTLPHHTIAAPAYVSAITDGGRISVGVPTYGLAADLAQAARQLPTVHLVCATTAPPVIGTPVMWCESLEEWHNLTR